MPAALETPGLDAIIERMDLRLVDLAAARDRRERFLLMYRAFKVELRRNLGEGRFRDPEWSELICCRMGQLYFDADAAYQAGPQECPEPWRHAFDSARGRRTNLLQDMLLGMNAHINYDLPLCTFQTMQRVGDVEELRQGSHTSLRFRQLLRRRYHDFLLINEIAWESIPLIQDLVCERFNPLLKVANILSFRFTQPIAEGIICEYRDRAWAHTLVLLTASGDQELEATRQHLARFALRAAHEVERLTLNPVRHLRRAAVPKADPSSARPVARTLVDHLGHRSTRAIARQALVEYGAEVQPELIRILTRVPPLAGVRGELYRILGAHPTAAAVETLVGALQRDREARAALLHVLADLPRGAHRDGMLQPLMKVAREELAEARRILGLASALGPEERRGSLLDRALRRKAHCALCRARDGLRAAGRPPAAELPPCNDALDRTPPLATLVAAARSIATAVGESPIEPDPPSREEVAVHLLAYPDPWVRTCAAWWRGLRAADASALEERVKRDDHELVKETALRALGRLVPDEQLREAAAHLVKRRTYTPGTPARSLAAQILEGEVIMITTIEKLLHLKNVELFQDVLAEDLVTIARVAKEHHFDAGETLIRKEEPGMATYVVVEGTVDVRGLDGQDLASIGAGGVLGEMSVVSDMPTSADCVAATAGLALRIAREDFHALLQDHPTTAIGVMHVLAQRLRTTNRRTVDVREPALT